MWIRPDGEIDHVYLKHEPVPGEPAVRGMEPMTVVETPLGRASGAICYDYDFPYLAARHARLNVDIMALPSSDWRGIDPIHTADGGTACDRGWLLDRPLHGDGPLRRHRSLVTHWRLAQQL